MSEEFTSLQQKDLGGFVAIQNDGTVVTWGSATVTTNAPVGLTDIKAIFSNPSAFAALKKDGAVVAWGNANYGGVAPEGLRDVKKIYSTTYSFAALKQDNTVVAWGPLWSGGTVPSGLNGVKAIYSTNRAFAAVYDNDNKVVAWGNSDYGGVAPENLSGVKAIYSNDYAFVAVYDNDNKVVAWGNPTYGGSAPEGLSGVESISSNKYAFAALKQDGTVVAWGTSDKGGSMTDADGNSFTLSDVKSIYSTEQSFAALKEDGTVVAWGTSWTGGSDVPAGLTNPNNDANYVKVTAIYSTSWAFAALKQDDTVVVWGSASRGGHGMPSGLSGVKAIYSNESFFAAVYDNDNKVATWGSGSYGSTEMPVGLSGVKAIYSTREAFAALKEDGTVVAWGISYKGGEAPNGLDNVATISYGNYYYNGQYYSSTVPVSRLPPVPPTITVIGDNPMTIFQDATASYTDLGASAVDSEGTNLNAQVQVSGDVVDLSTVGTYTVTYSVTDSNGGTSTANRTVNVEPAPTCFPAGTPIQTDQGVTAIDQLVPGEHTLRGKSIIAITQTRPLQKHIICFEKDSIGKNVPSQQTLCSKEHKVLYRGEMIKARDLADMCKNVKKIAYNGETLYNVLLEKHSKMLVNNMICETLHPENITAKFAKKSSNKTKL